MPSEIDLGYQAPDYSKMGEVGMGAPKASPEKPTKTCYPSITIPGNQGLAKSLQAGQEFTATVKFRVSEIAIHDRADADDGMVDSMYGGTRVELEAQSMSIDGMSIPEGDDEEDGKSAFRKFQSKKAMVVDSDDDED